MATRTQTEQKRREIEAKYDDPRRALIDPDYPLRIALLVYRGNPHSGGQGVYIRHLSRELTELGHEVTVFSGPPYPHLDAGVAMVPVPSLELYRNPDAFRVPALSEFGDLVDLAEFGVMCTAGFPEPASYSWRLRAELAPQRDEFDIVHDNQCLGPGILKLNREGFPLITTIHHPITVDRDLDLAHAGSLRRSLTLRRWYGFLRSQIRVARRVPYIITVSESSRRDISADMKIPAERMRIVPVGVDERVFGPRPDVARVPGRIMTTASADVPMKGVRPLLEAIAKVRTERDVELVVIGRAREIAKRSIAELDLADCVRFETGISDEELIRLYAEAEVAVVPSLYEGFSLPAAEAMACGVPLVATTGGAIPEVVGTSGETGVLVEPGNPDALAQGILQVLNDREFAATIGAAGRERVLSRFTWRACAEGTAAEYRRYLASHFNLTSKVSSEPRSLPTGRP